MRTSDWWLDVSPFPRPPLPPLSPTPDSGPQTNVLCLVHTSKFPSQVTSLAAVSTWNKCSSPRQLTSSLPHLQNFTPVTASQWGLHWLSFLKLHTPPFLIPFTLVHPFPVWVTLNIPQGWHIYNIHGLSPCTRLWVPGGRDCCVFCFDAQCFSIFQSIERGSLAWVIRAQEEWGDNPHRGWTGVRAQNLRGRVGHPCKGCCKPCNRV